MRGKSDSAAGGGHCSTGKSGGDALRGKRESAWRAFREAMTRSASAIFACSRSFCSSRSRESPSAALARVWSNYVIQALGSGTDLWSSSAVDGVAERTRAGVVSSAVWAGKDEVPLTETFGWSDVLLWVSAGPDVLAVGCTGLPSSTNGDCLPLSRRGRPRSPLHPPHP